MLPFLFISKPNAAKYAESGAVTLVGLLLSVITGGVLLAGLTASYGHGLGVVFLSYQTGGVLASMSFLLIKLQNQDKSGRL